MFRDRRALHDRREFIYLSFREARAYRIAPVKGNPANDLTVGHGMGIFENYRLAILFAHTHQPDGMSVHLGYKNAF